MTTEIAKPSDQLQGKNLSDLDNLVVRYSGMISAAKKHYAEKIATIPWSPETSKEKLAFWELLKKRKSEYNAERSPYTRGFDAIKSLCVAQEKEYDEIIGYLQAQKTTYDREQLALQKKENEKRAADAKLEGHKLTILPEIEKRMTEWVQEKKLEYLEAIAEGKPGPIVKMEDDTWQAICKSAIAFIGATEFVNELGREVVKPKKEILWKNADNDLQEFRLLGNKTAKQGQEAIKKLQETLGVVFKDEAEKAEQAVEAAHDTAIVNQAVAATPIHVGPAIKTKWIASPQNSAECLRVFNYFIQTMIAEDGEANTVAWMLKNLSSSVTRATRDANKGTKIEGVTYIEDVAK